MRVVYDKEDTTVYSSDPAAAPSRIESIYNVLYGHYEFVKPHSASEEDLRLVHWTDHLDYVKNNNILYQVAKIAVGGAIKAAELAVQGKSAFGLDKTAWASCWQKTPVGASATSITSQLL